MISVMFVNMIRQNLLMHGKMTKRIIGACHAIMLWKRSKQPGIRH